MYVELYNEKTNEQVKAKTGFSWTNLFFGGSGIVQFVRGDIGTGLITLGISILALMVGAPYVSFFISVFLACAYNKMYINKLQKKGFKFKEIGK